MYDTSLCVCASLTCFVCTLCRSRRRRVRLAVVLADARAADVQADHFLPDRLLIFAVRRSRYVLGSVAWRQGQEGRGEEKERKQCVKVKYSKRWLLYFTPFRAVEQHSRCSPVAYSGSSCTESSFLCCSSRRLLCSSSCWAALVTASNWCSLSNFLHGQKKNKKQLHTVMCFAGMFSKKWQQQHVVLSYAHSYHAEFIMTGKSNGNFFTAALITIYSTFKMTRQRERRDS